MVLSSTSTWHLSSSSSSSSFEAGCTAMLFKQPSVHALFQVHKHGAAVAAAACCAVQCSMALVPAALLIYAPNIKL
jgi:hypothetical protein